MSLQQIKDFPGYYMNVETCCIYSFKRQQPSLKKTRLNNTGQKVVDLQQNGQRRILLLNRLVFAVLNGVGYDDISSDVVIVRTRYGLRAIPKSDHISRANRIKLERRKDSRIETLDRYALELAIIRRTYEIGSPAEALIYIEERKSYFVAWFAKKYCCPNCNAEIYYSLAFDKMASRLSSPFSLLTNLSSNMMFQMTKERNHSNKCIVTPLYIPEPTDG